MPKPTRHRSAKSGKFVTAKTAKRRPATTVVETRKPKGKVWWGFEYRTVADVAIIELYPSARSAKKYRDSNMVTIKRYRVDEIG